MCGFRPIDLEVEEPRVEEGQLLRQERSYSEYAICGPALSKEMCSFQELV